MTIFISGHLSLTQQEFALHYKPRIDAALAAGESFVVGDARGADVMAQGYLAEAGCKEVTVYHMFDTPRNNPAGFPTVGGFQGDTERDVAMTAASDSDIAWVRPGRESSGTQANLLRRNN